MNLLFICGKNRKRSPTAEAVFATFHGIEVDSAGVDNDADLIVGSEVIEWADLIFVMEKGHQRKLTRRLQQYLRGKRVVSLDIRDDYEFMDPELVDLLKRKVTPHLKGRGT